MTTTYLTHAAELYATDGPTGEHVEVLRGQVEDYGGNVLFAGTADECVAKKFRVPTRRVPTEWRKVAGDVAGADYTWQLVTAANS